MSKKQKLTPWFPPEVKPVRPGVYQTQDKDLPGDTYYNLWDGVSWFYGFGELAERDTWRDESWPDSADSLKHWRGLAEQPK